MDGAEVDGAQRLRLERSRALGQRREVAGPLHRLVDHRGHVIALGLRPLMVARRLFVRLADAE